MSKGRRRAKDHYRPDPTQMHPSQRPRARPNHRLDYGDALDFDGEREGQGRAQAALGDSNSQ